MLTADFNSTMRAKGFAQNEAGEWVKVSSRPLASVPAQSSAKRIRQNTKPMMNKLETEFFESQLKTAQVWAVIDEVGRESDLHDDIVSELIRRRWYFVRSRMDRPTTQQKGVPDFICAAPDGRTFWIECKAKGNKLSKAQTISRHCLLALGHKWAVVYSFQEFITAINQ